MNRTILFVVCTVLVSPVVGNLRAVEPLVAIASADYDAHGRFRVNERPFFPILLYSPTMDDATLAELRDFGFNTLACRTEESIGLRERGFYAAIHKGKTKLDDLSSVLLAIGMDSPALNYKQDILKQTVEGNAKVREALPDRPLMNAIGYWEDEPQGVVDGKLPSQEKYDDLVAAIDVSAPYLYPIPYQSVSTVGDAVRRAAAATGGTKPVLPILQLFAWTPEARYPTIAELRCMVFLSLVEGAHGVGYYSFSHVTGKPKTTIAQAEPELWRSVKELNREVAEVGPRLVGGGPSAIFSLGKDAGPVRWKAVSDAAGMLAILVNPTADPQKVELHRHSGDTFEAASRTLEPWEVVIVRAKPGQ